MKNVYISIAIVTTLFFVYLCNTIHDYDKYRIHGENLIRQSTSSNKSAVMFDIDGTLIHGTQPIQPIIDLCNHAKQLGIAVILITARPETSITRSITERQLANHGIQYDALFFRPAAQKKILKGNLDLDFIFSVGDLPTDVDGAHGGVPILLKK